MSWLEAGWVSVGFFFLVGIRLRFYYYSYRIVYELVSSFQMVFEEFHFVLVTRQSAREALKLVRGNAPPPLMTKNTKDIYPFLPNTIPTISTPPTNTL